MQHSSSQAKELSLTLAEVASILLQRSTQTTQTRHQGLEFTLLEGPEYLLVRVLLEWIDVIPHSPRE